MNMKKAKISALFLALCLLLCACAPQNNNITQNDPPVSDHQQTPDDPTPPDNSGNDDGETQHPSYPAELAVELVVEWETADTLLSQLDELSDLLRNAVEEVGCPLDSVTLTISTAGGFTAQALTQGGIDAALLPAVDIISYEGTTSLIALSSEEIPATAIAVSQAKDDLSEEFCAVFLQALTETEAGQSFLSICCGSAAFSEPSETALQAVRDYLSELEENGARHAE